MFASSGLNFDGSVKSAGRMPPRCSSGVRITARITGSSIFAMWPGSGIFAGDAGELSLAAADVAAWLEARNTKESELSMLARQQLFWEAWVAAVAASPSPAAR